MNDLKRNFFKCGFLILSLCLAFNFGFVLSIFATNNVLGLSFHPEFFSGLGFGIAYFGSIYYGWLKK